MRELLKVHSAIIERSEPGHPGVAAVHELLSYPLHSEKKSGAELVCAVSLMKVTTSIPNLTDEENRPIVAFADPESRIRDFRLHEDWSDDLDADVLDLPIRSGCGADCFIVLLRTEALLAMMPDVDPESKSMIRWAATRQCRTFYFG